MVSRFEIRHTPNDHEFVPFTVIVDDGRPDEGIKRIPTQDKVQIITLLMDWLREKE